MVKLNHVIRVPVITEKSLKRVDDAVYSFEVCSVYVRKPEIRAAIEEIFDVKVESVRTQIFLRNTGRSRRGEKFFRLHKRAIVKLKGGMKIPLIEGV